MGSIQKLHRAQMGVSGVKYIKFADPEVLRVLIANGVSSDGVGITLADVEKVTSIGTWFKGNTEITSFDEFEKFTGVTELGSSNISVETAFYNCSNLKSINLPPNMERIYGASDWQLKGAFKNCANLLNVGNLNVLKYIGDYAFMGCENLVIQDLNLPNLLSIGRGAFKGVKVKRISDLGSITSFPAGNYDNGLLLDPDYLEEVNWPKSAKTIPSFALYNCKGIQAFNIEWEGVEKVGDNALENLGISVQEIRAENMTSLGYRPFIGWTINSFIAPNVTSMREGNYANALGSDGLSLTNIYMPSLTAIPNHAFYDTSIEYFEIGANCTSIGHEAFNRCTNLIVLNVFATTPPALNSTSFQNTPIASGTGYIYVPDASVDAYKAATNWATYEAQIKPLSELNG